MTYSAEVLADAPVVYYRLGEASGTTMADASGNASDGTYVNTPTLGAAGAISDGDTAVTFTRAQSEYATMPNTGLPSGASAYTLEAWIKPTVKDDSQGIISIGNFGVIGQSNAIRLNSAGTIRNYWWGNDLDAPGTDITLNAWNHIAATFDGTTRRLYVNGVDVGSDTPGTPDVTQTTATVGRARVSSSEYFNGGIDEAAVYDYALSAARIQAHFDAASAGAVGPALAGTLPALVDSLTVRSYTTTDTSNGRSGRIRGGYAIHADNTDPVILPAAAATRRDKALWYPEPELVDGRPVGPVAPTPEPESAVIPQTIPFTIGA